MSIIWTIIIGFVAGIVAKFLHPGSSNEPSGFILTAALGIIGARSDLSRTGDWLVPRRRRGRLHRRGRGGHHRACCLGLLSSETTKVARATGLTHSCHRGIFLWASHGFAQSTTHTAVGHQQSVTERCCPGCCPGLRCFC